MRFSALTLSANLALGIPRSKGAAIIHRNPGFPSPHGCNYQSVSRSKCFCSCNGTGPAFGYGKVADSRVARGVRFFGRNCAATAFFPPVIGGKTNHCKRFSSLHPLCFLMAGFSWTEATRFPVTSKRRSGTSRANSSNEPKSQNIRGRKAAVRRTRSVPKRKILLLNQVSTDSPQRHKFSRCETGCRTERRSSHHRDNIDLSIHIY